ncbi:MAG: 3-dehydroquinate synthase [Acidimicrobiia bacterium]|nr:3-dehydroquinate synthase [Acidimicrobiia bacterium]
MAPTHIDVTHAAGRYSVLVGSGLLGRLDTLLAEHRLVSDTVVVSCPPVWRAHGPALGPVLGGHPPLLIPDGERAKALATVAKLYEGFVARKAERSTVVIAVGGGVVGDAAGFAAATYLRGLRVVQVPTTLLAQVDSAIGGKTGVNLAAGKNLVGAFHAPSLVVCDPAVLSPLPRREFRAGLYEAIKYGVIASRSLFDHLTGSLTAIVARDEAVLTPLIGECCRIKAEVVMADEHEHGQRRILNFGHTVGHALEAITKYRRFRHGEAVGFGMLAAATLSHTRGEFPAADLEALRDVITHMGPLPATTDLKVSEALDAILLDKKVAAGTLHFVLPTQIGATRIATDITRKELTAALRSIGLR